MPTLQEKVTERAGIWSKMQEIMDRNGGVLSGEDARQYDSWEADLDRLGDEIDRAGRHEGHNRDMSTVNRAGVVPGQRGTFGQPLDDASGDPEQDAYDRVFDQFIREGALELNAEDRTLLKQRLRQDKEFRNAAGVGTGSAGGYAVPPLFRDKFVEALKYFGPMASLAEQIVTESGATLPWPTNDDTGNMGAILAENTQVSEQDVTLGTASLDAYMYTSLLVRVSFQMLNDVPGFDNWLARKLGERIGRRLNNHWTVGTGTAQPLGIVPGGTVGVTGSGSLATTTGISYDNLIDLIEALDPAYQASDNLTFMMHQSMRKAIRKLKDGQSRPLWEPSVQVGQPDSLLGYRLAVNNDMATVAVNSKSLLFGDVREAYVTRIVNDLAIMRLGERYADFLQVGFLGFERAGGTVQNTAAYRVFQTTPTA
jgi:HK97 family phage major capsid protein